MGHWYDKDGIPKHHEGRGGKPTTLREARKFGYFPSVTTVLNAAAKPALTNWLQEQAALVAAELVQADAICGDVEHLTHYGSGWAKSVVRAAREKTMAKADEGTDIHAILEAYFDGNPVGGENLELCRGVEQAIEEHTGECEWKTEVRFCDTELGYAGMCDLHNDEWVIDFKTKDHVDESTRGWPEQASQLAAYAHGLGVPDARLANVFISRADPTQVVFYEHQDPWAWDRFLATLRLWQITKRYGPLFDELEQAT